MDNKTLVLNELLESQRQLSAERIAREASTLRFQQAVQAAENDLKQAKEILKRCEFDATQEQEKYSAFSTYLNGLSDSGGDILQRRLCELSNSVLAAKSKVADAEAAVTNAIIALGQKQKDVDYCRNNEKAVAQDLARVSKEIDRLNQQP